MVKTLYGVRLIFSPKDLLNWKGKPMPKINTHEELLEVLDRLARDYDSIVSSQHKDDLNSLIDYVKTAPLMPKIPSTDILGQLTVPPRSGEAYKRSPMVHRTTAKRYDNLYKFMCRAVAQPKMKIVHCISYSCRIKDVGEENHVVMFSKAYGANQFRDSLTNPKHIHSNEEFSNISPVWTQQVPESTQTNDILIDSLEDEEDC